MFAIFSFLVWRVALLVVVLIAPTWLTLQTGFLGVGNLGNYDGVHYLEIAQRGYSIGEQVFFPLYPLLIRILSFGGGINSYLVGLIISNLSFLVGLVGLYKLLRIDFSIKIARWTVVLLLLFPASFYLGSVYTEGLFFALVVWSLYFSRKSKYIKSVVLASFATATRMIGVIMLPVLAVELIREKDRKKLAYLLVVPLGLAAYSYYVYLNTGDPLAFFRLHAGLGEHRSVDPVLLPQVIYRYMIKILPNLNYSYFPQVFFTWMEFVVSIGFLVLSVVSFFKLRLSYSLYLALGFLAPTFSGSFSSMPRLVAILFPGFLLLALGLSKAKRSMQIGVVLVFIVCWVIAASLFSQGYWIA